MYKPIKMKRSMKYGSNYWEGYSPKVKRTVRFFSDLEYDHWVMVETNPNIETFCEQPIRIKQILNEEISESVIDMWVRYKNGEEIFFEIKYLSELDKRNPKSARAIKQIAAQKTWCEEKGYKHCVRTEIDIRANELYLNNLRRIISYVRNINIRNEIDNYKVIELVKVGVRSLLDIEKNLSYLSASRVRESVSHLIYTGDLNSNIDIAPFGNKTEVWVRDEQ